MRQPPANSNELLQFLLYDYSIKDERERKTANKKETSHEELMTINAMA